MLCPVEQSRRFGATAAQAFLVSEVARKGLVFLRVRQDLKQTACDLPHQTCDIEPSLFGMKAQAPNSCRATRPACLAVHLDSSALSAIVSFHRSLSCRLAARQQRDAQSTFMRSSDVL